MAKLSVQGNHIYAGSRTIGHVQGNYIYSGNNLPIVHVQGNYIYGGNDIPVGTMDNAQSLIDGGKRHSKNILAAIYLLFRK